MVLLGFCWEKPSEPASQLSVSLPMYLVPLRIPAPTWRLLMGTVHTPGWQESCGAEGRALQGGGCRKDIGFVLSQEIELLRHMVSSLMVSSAAAYTVR